MSELVSVVVPFFNSSKYLKDCIESIVNQTYTELQIILIDDGSTDNSLEIAKQYEKKDGRITLIHKENGGISSARNIGLDQACGSYITWIDSDDIVACDFVESLLGCFSEEIDLVQCGFFDFRTKARFDFFSGIITVYDSETIIKTYLLQEYNDFSLYLWGKMYKRTLYKDLTFPEDQTNSEELVILSKILTRTRKIAFLDRYLYAYRLSDNSLTRKTNWSNYIHSAFLAENRRIEYWKEFGREDFLCYELIGATKTAIIMYCRGFLHKCDKEDLKGFLKIKKDYENVIEPYLNKKQIIRFRLFKYSRLLYFITLFLPYELFQVLRRVKK